MDQANGGASYERKYLPSIAFKALTALAEVMVTSPDERISPEKVAENVDSYMASFTAGGAGSCRWRCAFCGCIRSGSCVRRSR